MKKKSQANITSIMVMIAIGLIIGVVMLQIIFSQISEQTTTKTQSDIQFAVQTKGICTRVTSRCIQSISSVVNNTGASITGNFTRCGSGTDLFGHTFNQSGDSDIDLVGDTVNTTFIEESCSRIEGALTTTVVNNVPILFAVALLVFVAGFLILKG